MKNTKIKTIISLSIIVVCMVAFTPIRSNALDGNQIVNVKDEILGDVLIDGESGNDKEILEIDTKRF